MTRALASCQHDVPVRLVGVTNLVVALGPSQAERISFWNANLAPAAWKQYHCSKEGSKT